MTVADNRCPIPHSPEPQWAPYAPESLGELPAYGGTIQLAPFVAQDGHGGVVFERAGGPDDTAPESVTVDARSGELVVPAGLAGTAQQVKIRLSRLPLVLPPPVDLVDLTVVAEAPAPWTAAHAFPEGAAPYALASSWPGALQVDVLNRWPDGSIKLALLSGIGPPGRVTLQSTLACSHEEPVAPITAADVGDTYVVLSGERVSLADAIAGADLRGYNGASGRVPAQAGIIRDWVAGPVMRESHFYAPVITRPGLAVVWHVRKYASGAVEITTIVENGWLGLPASMDGYVASVVINGTGRAWHDGLAERTVFHGEYRRWSRVDWVGADPAVTVLHDTRYLTDTRLVPHYGWPVESSEESITVATASRNPGSPAFRTIASISDAEVSAPSPFDSGFWRTLQNSGGEEHHGQIGLLPSWDCIYLRTGDPRALRAVLFNARQWQFIPTWRRDERTLMLPVPDATTRIAYGNNNAEREHQPSTGYLAYLLTGRPFFLETCQNTALWNFFKSPPAEPWPAGQGGSRGGAKGILLSGEFTTRAIGWSWRSLVTAACITPDVHELRAPLLHAVESNIDYFWGLQRDGSPMKNDLGIVWTVAGDTFYSQSFLRNSVRVDGDPVGEPLTLIRLDPWQHSFVSSAIGFTRGLGLVSGQSAADLASLHEFSARVPIGRMGDTHDGSGYSWRRCGTYKEPVGLSSRPAGPLFNPPASFFSSWRDCYDFTRDYWGATDHDDSPDRGYAVFDTWVLRGGSFGSGFEPGYPPTIDRSGTVADIPSRTPTRAMLAPLAIAADYGVQGARAAYEKIVGSPVYRDNPSARQALADAPKFVVTPR